MNLSEVKSQLRQMGEVKFELPDGSFVPRHFHVTEVGQVNRNFIDCGGTVRNETIVNFQLWQASDYEHRLAPNKLVDIIELSERILGIGNHQVEVEFQSNTIGRYQLGFNGQNFVLNNMTTNCLAPDKCGIPQEKTKISLSELTSKQNECTPGSGCC